MANLTSAQEKVVNHEKGNILISASAGSGKTHTMIERVIRLILNGKARVEEILAVTFTEKAAADMKEKLKSALIKTVDESGKKWLSEQINAVQTSDISTIHSFCARLIRNYFYQAGVASDFKIADDGEAAVILEQSLDKVMREFYESEEDWFYNLVDRHVVNRSDSGLRGLLVDAYHYVGNEADKEEFLSRHKLYFTKDGVDDFAREYKESIDKKLAVFSSEIKRAVKYFATESMPKLESFSKGVEEDIAALLSVDSVYGLKAFYPYDRKVSTESKLDESALAYKKSAVGIRDRLKKIIESVASSVTDEHTEKQRVSSYYKHIEGFITVLKRFSEVYEKAKREENLLDFNDLERFTLKILENEEILEEVKSRYKYIFIDEYQDVNSVQEKILTLISSDNLLMVGDLKQGIYAFRGCRSEIFAGKLIDMPARGEEVVRLNENFRSAKKVIEFVNRIFCYCMTTSFFEENYAGSAELVFGGLFPDGYEGRAAVHRLAQGRETKKPQKPVVYDLLSEVMGESEKDFGSTVSLLTEIINDELGKTIYDVKNKCERRVRMGDIAILTRAKSNDYAANIVKGLTAHGFSVVADAEENVCDFPEILMLINALKLVDCFEQDLPLASTLKSAIGGFNDEDLFKIVRFCKDNKKAKSFYQAYSYYLEKGEGELKERLQDFDKYFSEVRFLSDFLGAEGTLKKLVEEKEVEAQVLAEREGEVKLQRIKRFILAAVSGNRKLTVKEFLAKIESSGDAFSLYECGEENAVKVMTMHSSKGLEFPVVIVCGLERLFDSQDDRKEIFFNRKYGFVPRYYNEEKRTKEKTLFRGVITANNEEERIREEMRLFYVATTRATYSLHLVFSSLKDTRSDEFVWATRFSDFIPSDIEAIVHEPNEFEFIELKKGRRKVIFANGGEALSNQVAERLSFKYSHEEDIDLPLKSNVTSASKPKVEEEYKSHEVYVEATTDTDRGTTAHKILELYDFFSGEDFYSQVKRMVDCGLIEKSDVEKLDLEKICRAVNGGWREVLKGKKLYREKGFLTAIEAKAIFPQKNSEEKLVLQGVIDLLCVDGEEAYIIDYKYSTKSREGLKEFYKKQLDLYAYAVQKVLNVKVKSKKIINLLSGEWVDIP